jgi:hypothetical protein
MNILLLGGLDEHMKKKKGKKRDKHIREFLDANLRVSSPGDGNAERRTQTPPPRSKLLN